MQMVLNLTNDVKELEAMRAANKLDDFDEENG